jgi:LmbE family N-acetylglucosaminyl deacetylase
MKLFSRRKILTTGSMLAATAAVGLRAPALVRAAQEKSTPSLKVVITGGHPGDPEYGCGGTISRLTELGHEAVLLYLNQGEPVESATRMTGYRVEEAKKASEILKARPAYVGQIDGNAIVDQLHYKQFREILEKENPSVVFTHWPIDNHADHRAISMLVYDAWLHVRKKFSLFYYEVSNGEDTQQFAPSDYGGYFRKRAEEASGLLCARHTGSRQVLRATRRSCTLARHRERPHSCRGIHQARSKSSLRAARLIVPRIMPPATTLLSRLLLLENA